MKRRLCALVVAAIAAFGGCAGVSNSVPPPAPLARIASATPQPLIFVGLNVNGRTGIAEFHRGANGNVKPIRAATHADTLVSLFGVDDVDNFWALFRSGNPNDDPTFYAVHFSSKFAVLGTVSVNDLSSATVDSKGDFYAVVLEDTIVEYAAGSYGKKVLRTIDLPHCTFPPTPQLSVDGSGNLYSSAYLSCSGAESLGIAQWAPKSSGYATPERTIPMGSAAPSEMLADAGGDLYMAFGSGSYSFGDGIWRWAAGSSTPQWLLPGLPIKAFALDSTGNIYAEVPTIENDFAIEVFSPAGQMIADIAGTKTRLGYPSAITVTP